MSEIRKILVAVDDSDACKAALARVVARHADDGSAIRLFHVVGPIPPALLEFGGADTPAEEERIERAYEVAQSDWFNKARDAALPMLESAQATLVAGGIAADRIEGHVADSLPEDRLGHLILEDARESGCDAVVIGHTSYGWLAKHFHGHVQADLQKHGGDLKIVIVE